MSSSANVPCPTPFLFNVMPERIVRRIRVGEASVLFLDLVGFTSFAAKTDPEAREACEDGSDFTAGKDRTP